MRKAAALSGFVAVAVAVALAPGCTVFSGWGDLQGGQRDAGKAPTGDSGAVQTPDATTPGARCTVASCAPKICCVHKDGTMGCVDSCTDPDSKQVDCTTSSDCTGGGVCCIGSSGASGWQASCTSSCITGLIACEPGDPNSCPAPKKCGDPSMQDAGALAGSWFFSFCQ